MQIWQLNATSNWQMSRTYTPGLIFSTYAILLQRSHYSNPFILTKLHTERTNEKAFSIGRFDFWRHHTSYMEWIINSIVPLLAVQNCCWGWSPVACPLAACILDIDWSGTLEPLRNRCTYTETKPESNFDYTIKSGIDFIKRLKSAFLAFHVKPLESYVHIMHFQ